MSEGRRVRDFVETSFEALREECPRAHAAMAAALATAVVRIAIDGEEFSLLCRRGTLVVTSALLDPTVEVTTDRRTIVDVVEARISLLECVLTDRLVLRGEPAALASFHDALMMYVAGGLRAPAFPVLLDAFADRLSGNSNSLQEGSLS